MLDLKLSIKPGNWQVFMARSKDPRFQVIAKQVFERDYYTCQYCGFQAKQYQQIVNHDNNYSNYTKSNLVTACCFCSQCLFLESVGLDEMGGGQLLYLPEISQADLNSFCHVLFCAMGNGTNYQDSAQTVYRSLKFRSQIVESKFGEGTSSPQVFGQLIVEHGARDKNVDTDNLLKDLRLLPAHNKFRVQLEAWAKAALEELSAEEAGS